MNLEAQQERIAELEAEFGFTHDEALLETELCCNDYSLEQLRKIKRAFVGLKSYLKRRISSTVTHTPGPLAESYYVAGTPWRARHEGHDD